MNRLAVFAAMTVMCAAVLCQAAPGNPGLPDTPAGMGGWSLPQDPETYIKTIDPVANLTDEQKKAITDAFNLMTIDLAETNLKANGHPDYAQVQEVMKKSQERIEKVLTAAQVKLLKDADVTSLIKNLAKPAQLTDAQIKAIKGTVDCTDIKALRQAIADILTPEQKLTYNKGRAVMYLKSYYWNAKLTDDQTKQIQAAVEQLGKDASLSDTQLADKIKEKIDPILTPAQKKIMEPLPPAGGTAPLMRPAQ